MPGPQTITDAEYRAEYQNIRLLTKPRLPPPHVTMTQLHQNLQGACELCGFPPGEPGYLRSDFPVGHRKFGALIPCPECHESTLPEQLSKASQLSAQLRTKTFKSYRVLEGNRDAYDAALAFANGPRRWLTLWGSFGPGKTHLLAAVVNHCTFKSTAAVYYTLPDLLDKLRDTYSDNGFSPFFDKLVNVPVLALDEIDKVRLTEWAMEKVYQLMDARYRESQQRGTILALNMQPDPGHEHWGYLFSRMSEFKIVQVGGGDVRPAMKESDAH